MRTTIHAARVRSAAHDLELVLRPVEVGTAARPVTVSRLDRAIANIDDWTAVRAPGTSGDSGRGGSSSPVERDERRADERLARQAAHDRRRVRDLVVQIEGAAEELARLVARNVETAPVRAEDDRSVPGCLSCARVGVFSPVRETAKASGLCDWCYRFARAAVRNDGGNRVGPIEAGHYPPRKAVELYHERGARSAGRWLAENGRGTG